MQIIPRILPSFWLQAHTLGQLRWPPTAQPKLAWHTPTYRVPPTRPHGPVTLSALLTWQISFPQIYRGTPRKHWASTPSATLLALSACPIAPIAPSNVVTQFPNPRALV